MDSLIDTNSQSLSFIPSCPCLSLTKKNKNALSYDIYMIEGKFDEISRLNREKFGVECQKNKECKKIFNT